MFSRFASRAARSATRQFSSTPVRRNLSVMTVGTVATAVGGFALMTVGSGVAASGPAEAATKEDIKAITARMDANDIDAAVATNSAFVFIKPHAVTDQVKALLNAEMAKMGITITSQGMIDAEAIDAKQLIDTHYGAIANRAVKQKPTELVVTSKAAASFESAFGTSWKDAVASGKVFNAADACVEMGITGAELGNRFDTLTKGKNLIKFGGGFYLGQVGDLYVVNGFYMNMREKYCKKGEKIYYYTVEFPANNMTWQEFRSEKLGATDPTEAAVGSLRQQVYANWEELGLPAKPNTGDNGVHASASPYEALAERMNWLGAKAERDTYGKGLIAAGVPAATIAAWSSDPQVKGGSIFDALEDLGAKDCLMKARILAK